MSTSDPTPATEQRQQVDAFVAGLMRGAGALLAVSTRSVSDVHDSVTLPQFRILLVLASQQPVRLTRLAQLLGVDPSTAVRMVDRLVEAGLATRQENPLNRREVLLTATPTGADIVRRVTAHRRRQIAKIVNAMPVTPRNELIEALTLFSHTADAQVSPLAW